MTNVPSETPNAPIRSGAMIDPVPTSEASRHAETGPSDAVRSLVDALYRDFLLRDLFAKVVPGAILGLSLFMDRELTLAALGQLEISAPVALLLAGCAWIVGFAVQGIGEALRLMVHYPREYRQSESRYGLRIRFKRVASVSEQRRSERYAIIKEAAGNGGTAFFLAAVVLLARALTERGPLFQSGGTLVMILLVLFVLSLSLLYTNRTHARKQYDFMDQAVGLAQPPTHHPGSGA